MILSTPTKSAAQAGAHRNPLIPARIAALARSRGVPTDCLVLSRPSPATVQIWPAVIARPQNLPAGGSQHLTGSSDSSGAIATARWLLKGKSPTG